MNKLSIYISIFFVLFFFKLCFSQEVNNKTNKNFFIMGGIGFNSKDLSHRYIKRDVSTTASLSFNFNNILLDNVVLNIEGAHHNWGLYGNPVRFENWELVFNLIYKIKIFTIKKNILYFFSGIGYNRNYLKYNYDYNVDDNTERKALTQSSFKITDTANGFCLRTGILYDIKPGLIRPAMLLMVEFNYNFVKFKNLGKDDKKLYKQNDYYFFSKQKPAGSEDAEIDLTGYSIRFGIGFWIF